jgi:hypothetical protein
MRGTPTSRELVADSRERALKAAFPQMARIFFEPVLAAEIRSD